MDAINRVPTLPLWIKFWPVFAIVLKGLLTSGGPRWSPLQYISYRLSDYACFALLRSPARLFLYVTLLLSVVGLKLRRPSVFSVSCGSECASIIECGISFEIRRMFFVVSISLQHDAHACLSGGRILEQRPVAIL